MPEYLFIVSTNNTSFSVKKKNKTLCPQFWSFYIANEFVAFNDIIITFKSNICSSIKGKIIEAPFDNTNILELYTQR